MPDERERASDGEQRGWQQRRHRGMLPRMTSPVLTQEKRDDAMARAEQVACAPGDSRCYAFPDPLDDARATCTPKGRCKIGWIVKDGGRTSWDVWLDLHPGEGRLRKQEDALERSRQVVALAETAAVITYRPPGEEGQASRDARPLAGPGPARTAETGPVTGVRGVLPC